MPISTTYTRLTLKRVFILSALILSVFVLLSPHHTSAQGNFEYDWDINSFNTDITIREDSSLYVQETLQVDFTRVFRHGIYRTIPVKYQDKFGQTFKLRLNVVSVTDEAGNDWWYDRSNEGDYVSLKIGDPDRTFNEEMTYVITYEVKRAVSFQFDDHDELYWNATGDEWDVEIEQASATITFPDSVPSKDLEAICFTGFFGSTDQNCSSEVIGNMISYDSEGLLMPFEGLTIVAGFPKGHVQPVGFTQELIWTLQDNWGYLLPVITFLVLYYLWWTRGRDPKTNRDTVMPIYKPPEGLSPSEAGTLIDENADMRDLSATIIDMAVRGYIKINEKKKKKLGIFEDSEYEFELLKSFKDDNSLYKHEKATLEGIFSTSAKGTKKKLADLKYKFYKDIPNIKTAVYKRLVDKKYFPTRPDHVRDGYYGLGIFIVFGVFFTMGWLLIYNIALVIGLGLSGVVILGFAKFMPAKTKKGVEMYYQVLGLEEYISTAETDRLKWKEKVNVFEQLLPYAMAFNITDKWTDAFKDVYKEAPNWYSSNDPNYINNFNTGYLLGRLNSLSSSMNSSLAAAPRSSGSGGAWSGGSGFGGGGFSGGGFGGGGGGSW